MISLLGRRAAGVSHKGWSTGAGAVPRRVLAPTPILAHRSLFLAPTQPRFAANPQSNKPASDNLEHMIQNVKEEAGGVRKSVESAVAGSPSQGSGGEIIDDAKSIIGTMAKKMPRPAVWWGSAGIIPYVSTAGASIYLARQSQLVAQGLDSHIDFETASALLLHAENVQITFGAILLSFLGAIHWGFEFSKFGGERGNRRYLLGLVPVAIAWPTLILEPHLALTCQWAGFVATWFIDLRATQAGWAPQWYSSYRFGLTLAVGLSIIATLAGTNYYDADKSRSSSGISSGVGTRLAAVNSATAEKIRASAAKIDQGIQSGPKLQKKVEGDVIAESSDDDGFVRIRNPKREEQERKEKEEEEKKKKQEEAEKKKKEKEDKGGKEGDKKEGGKGEEKEDDGEDEGGDDDDDGAEDSDDGDDK